MIRLTDITEDNWQDVARLSVEENQRAFLDSSVGILARGYVYRASNARVIGIADDQTMIGVALVRDLDEEPACYDLQQFMIDRQFQHKGYGCQALSLILAMLQQEGKYACVEVCVHKSDTPALRMYEKAEFQDTGYIDDNCPSCLNLMYYFK
ncbi:MAG: GNAT family N-acetyltransferase [Clostridiaceae bacterium]